MVYLTSCCSVITWIVEYYSPTKDRKKDLRELLEPYRTNFLYWIFSPDACEMLYNIFTSFLINAIVHKAFYQ